jgi:Flp pilus assembly protein CpaB
MRGDRERRWAPGLGRRQLAMGTAPRLGRVRSARMRWLAAIALATGAAMTVASASERADRTLAGYGRLRTVVVARHSIAPGQGLSPADVFGRRDPIGSVPDGAVAGSPVGRTALDPIGPGEVVTAGHLAPSGLHGLAAMVAAGHRAISVPVAEPGLTLEVGQQVDLVAAGGGASSGGAGGAVDDDENGADRPDGGGRGAGFGTIVARAARILAVGDRAVVVEVTDAEVARVAGALADAPPVIALRGAS